MTDNIEKVFHFLLTMFPPDNLDGSLGNTVGFDSVGTADYAHALGYIKWQNTAKPVTDFDYTESGVAFLMDEFTEIRKRMQSINNAVITDPLAFITILRKHITVDRNGKPFSNQIELSIRRPSGIAYINVDSSPELYAIDPALVWNVLRARFSIRHNPYIDLRVGTSNIHYPLLTRSRFMGKRQSIFHFDSLAVVNAYKSIHAIDTGMVIGEDND